MHRLHSTVSGPGWRRAHGHHFRILAGTNLFLPPPNRRQVRRRRDSQATGRQADPRRSRRGRLRRGLARQRQQRSARRQHARRSLFDPQRRKGEGVGLRHRKLEVAGKAIKVSGEAAPVAADWDGAGKLDLIVGGAEGEVLLFRNVGTRTAPKLQAPRFSWAKALSGGKATIAAAPPIGACASSHAWSIGAGAGRLDLLLGDMCGGFNAKPSQTEQERTDERTANDQLPQLRRQWSETFGRYRQAGAEPAGETARAKSTRLGALDAAREELGRLREEISRVEQIRSSSDPAIKVTVSSGIFNGNRPKRKVRDSYALPHVEPAA